METHARTILKSLTWRVGGFVMTTLVALVLTRRADLAASIGLLDTGVKIVAFYIHERAWLRVRFGMRRPPEYDI